MFIDLLFAIEVFLLYPLIIFHILGKFKGGGFMDSGPYPYHSRNHTTIHTGQRYFDRRRQTPSLKGGK